MAISQKRRDEYATVGKSGYPIPPGDKSHARAALMLINKGGLSHDQKMKVIERAHKVLQSKK